MGRAEVGIFSGSGLYTLLEAAEEVKVDTPYGAPSDLITLGEIEGRKVAFLPRHGKRHQYPPHTIPYRANLWAMKSLGVTRILAPCVVGSLQPHIKPGDIVVCDQFVDRTRGRRDTFYDGPVATHIPTADPYCPELRSIVIGSAEALRLNVHPRGTVVVIQGPRFSTKAESLWFKGQGWEVINMTQYPEVVLARELEMCYVNISLVTDYDVWREERVSAEEVQRVSAENLEKVKKLIHSVIPHIPASRSCPCPTILQSSRL